MILHLNDDHFAAAWPVDDDRLIFLDLPDAPVMMRRSALQASWKGPALVVAPSRAELDRSLARSGF